ncbi:hypothetical protein BRC87_02170 [Halobacteriales archaeon QS_4_66_20]|nr:MAG: hypothetical protein BRC87_02170 [Halobacteriales archaeon QS_4_66_20]
MGPIAAHRRATGPIAVYRRAKTPIAALCARTRRQRKTPAATVGRLVSQTTARTQHVGHVSD